MIDINKAQKQITKHLTCQVLDKDITNEGVYLVFENIKMQNHLNVDYIFSLYVAFSSFNKNRVLMYAKLNKALNEINSSLNIDLNSCNFLKATGNLLIYKLDISTRIIGN